MAYASITKPSLHFNTKIYTGNGSTNAITGVGYAPNLTWIKDRDASNGTRVFDTTRGATKGIFTDSTAAQATVSSELTAFGTDGFTLGSDGSVNGSSKNYVAWNWKAGTAVSGNTEGSGTAKTYTGSVNTTAGFSIIKYTGNGTIGHQIPHRLGVAPNMIIIKHLSASENWFVYHSSLGNNKDLLLNLTNDATGTVTTWNTTSPTSTVWSMSNQSAINDVDDEFIAYCFAEKKGYSKFGSYTGNGNTSGDGAFIYLGFKPAFFMVKNVSASGHGWYMFDNKRDVDNPTNKYLVANTSAADASFDWMDFNSNGIKVRGNSGGANNSGESYIYMAFAEEPLVANVGASIPATAR